MPTPTATFSGTHRATARRLAALLAAVLMLWLPATAHGEEPFDALVRYVPPGANLLITIDMARLLDSPKGNFEDWPKQAALKFAHGLTSIPPDATRVVMAAQFDIARREPRWEVSAMDVSKVLSPDRLAHLARGFVDPLVEVPAAWSPYNAYYVKLGPTRLGIMAPAHRQRVSRWAKADPEVSLSPFLSEAYRAAGSEPHEVLLALDLEDALDPELVAAAVADAKTLGAEASGASELINSLRGVVVRVSFAPKPTGQVRLVFGQNPALLAGKAVPLFAELLANCGATAGGLEGWRETIDGKSIVLSGDLTNTQTRKLFMLSHLHLPESDDSLTGGDEKLSMADATLRQFALVSLLLSDAKLREQERLPSKECSMWLGKYAQRIESLPSDNVDPEMVPYRTEVVQRLRRLREVIEEPARPKGVDPDFEAEVKGIRLATKELRKTLAERYQRDF